MKTIGILAAILITSINSAEASKGNSLFDRLVCYATGKVDNIIKLVYEETDLEGQNCGYYLIASKNGEKAVQVGTCFNGSITKAESNLVTTRVSEGVNKLDLRYDEKNGFSLVKVFQCGINYEEHCNPWGEEILVEEKLDCTITKIKY